MVFMEKFKSKKAFHKKSSEKKIVMGYFKSVQSIIYNQFNSGPAPNPADGCKKGQKSPSNVCKKPNKQLERMKGLQEKFQQKDGKPIFLKMGIRDQILYRLTMLLAIIGVFETCRMVYDMSAPSKPKPKSEEPQ